MPTMAIGSPAASASALFSWRRRVLASNEARRASPSLSTDTAIISSRVGRSLIAKRDVDEVVDVGVEQKGLVGTVAGRPGPAGGRPGRPVLVAGRVGRGGQGGAAAR